MRQRTFPPRLESADGMPVWPSSVVRHVDEFIADLEVFLAALPAGWPYGIELRNRQWLTKDYFDCLARHHITQLFISWPEPPVSEQLVLPRSRPQPDLVTARFQLTPGRKYAEAVEALSPYTETKAMDPAARRAECDLIAEGFQAPQRKTIIYVNNRLEGNAIHTIEAMVEPVSR